MSKRWRRRAVLPAVAAALTMLGVVHTAGDSIPASSAGEGSGTVTITTTPDGHIASTTTPSFTSFKAP